MPEYANRSYRFKDGRVSYIFDPFENDMENLRELIRFLMDFLGIDPHEVLAMLRRDLDRSTGKITAEINSVLMELKRKRESDFELELKRRVELKRKQEIERERERDLEEEESSYEP